MTNPAPKFPSRKLAIALVLLITLVGLGLRFYKVSNQALWTDEVFSLISARVPLNQIVRVCAQLNNCSPAYFLLLRAVAGESDSNLEFRARLISVLTGALSIPVFVAVVYLWRRRADAALAAGALLAINPMHIWYSQETRAYASMLLFGLLALLFFEIARERRRALWWIAYIICSLLAAALHKTGIIFSGACSLWHAWQLLRTRQRPTILLVHLVVFVIAVLLLFPKSYPPDLPYRRPFSVLEIPYTLVTYLGGYSFGPSLADIQAHGPLRAALANWKELAVVGVVLALILSAYVSNFQSLISSKPAALLLLSMTMAIGYSAVAGFPYNIRYTLPALLGFVAFAAIPFLNVRHGLLARATLLSVFIVSLWADYQWYYSPEYRKEDTRSAAQWLIKNEAHFASWSIVPAYSFAMVNFYLQVLGHPEITSRLQMARENQTTSFPPVPDVFIVGRRDRILRPEETIAAYQTAVGNRKPPDSVAGLQIYSRNPSP